MKVNVLGTNGAITTEMSDKPQLPACYLICYLGYIYCIPSPIKTLCIKGWCISGYRINLSILALG